MASVTSSGDDLKVPSGSDEKPIVEGILVDGTQLFLFDSSRLEDETFLESDCYVTLEEAR